MISRDDIKKLAALARMDISSEEEEAFTKEIDSILGYVAQIQEASGADAVKGSERVKNVLRNDTHPHEPGKYSKEILDNAPKREGEYVKVKKIL